VSAVSGAALGVGSAGATARAEHSVSLQRGTLAGSLDSFRRAIAASSNLATMSLFTLLDQADEGMGILACQ